MFGRALAQSAVDRKLETTAEADYSCVCGRTREKFDLKYTPFYMEKKNKPPMEKSALVCLGLEICKIRKYTFFNLAVL